jgi:MinD superfamily P-loop ATPase
MASLRTPALVAALDDRRCSGCRWCLPTCDARALVWATADNELFLDSWACTGCGDCVRICPEGALTLAPRGRP